MNQYPVWPNLAAMMFGRAREWRRRPMLRHHRDGAWHSIRWGEFARRAAREVYARARGFGGKQQRAGVFRRAKVEGEAERGELIDAHHRRTDERGGVDGRQVARASAPFLREALRWYRAHAHYGVLRDLPFDVAHALWLGPAQEWVRHWLEGETRTVPRAVARELAAAAWRALSTDPDQEAP